MFNRHSVYQERLSDTSVARIALEHHCHITWCRSAYLNFHLGVVLIKSEYAIITRANNAIKSSCSNLIDSRTTRIRAIMGAVAELACPLRILYCIGAEGVGDAQFLLPINIWMTYFAGLDSNRKQRRGSSVGPSPCPLTPHTVAT